MILLGLTGSIATGKTTVARQFAALGVAVHDADAAVHRLLDVGGAAVAAVARAFPGVEKRGRIDRAALGKIVFSDEKKLARLEAILHPLVVASEQTFIRACRNRRVRVALLDIPLLFETRAERRVQKTIAVVAPHFLQARRALLRPGMTEEKFSRILARQMPQHRKRARADFTVHTGLGLAYSFRQVKSLMASFKHSTR